MSRTSGRVALREPRRADWPAILSIANESVGAVGGAGTQEAWLRNRRRPWPIRRHLVAIDAGSLVGYGAVESHFDQMAGGFRLFVVTPPARLADVGSALYRELEALLEELGAAEAWFIEYAADDRLLAFTGERGFREVRRFRLDDGAECVVSSRGLGRP